MRSACPCSEFQPGPPWAFRNGVRQMASLNKSNADRQHRECSRGAAPCRTVIPWPTSGWQPAGLDRPHHPRAQGTYRVAPSIVCYRQRAEFVRDYLGKGRQIYIEGLLRTHQVDGQSGHRALQHRNSGHRDVQPLGARPEGSLAPSLTKIKQRSHSSGASPLTGMTICRIEDKGGNFAERYSRQRFGLG